MPKKTKQDVGKKVKELDLDPDAWPRFERLIHDAAKMGHKPHKDGGPTDGKPRKRRESA